MRGFMRFITRARFSYIDAAIVAIGVQMLHDHWYVAGTLFLLTGGALSAMMEDWFA